RHPPRALRLHRRRDLHPRRPPSRPPPPPSEVQPRVDRHAASHVPPRLPRAPWSLRPPLLRRLLLLGRRGRRSRRRHPLLIPARSDAHISELLRRPQAAGAAATVAPLCRHPNLPRRQLPLASVRTRPASRLTPAPSIALDAARPAICTIQAPS